MQEKIHKCPVCNKSCLRITGLSSHLFKQKDNEHKEYVKKIEKRALEVYKSFGKIETVAKEFGIGQSFIREVWRKQPDYKEHGRKLLSMAGKKNYAEGKFKIGNIPRKNIFEMDKYKEIIPKVKELFYSELPKDKIAEELDISENVVKRVFEKFFDKKDIKERSFRLRSKARKRMWKNEESREKMKNNMAKAVYGEEHISELKENLIQLTPEVLDLYNSNLTTKEIADKFKIQQHQVNRIWEENKLKIYRKWIRGTKAQEKALEELKERDNGLYKKILTYWNEKLSARDIAKKLNIRMASDEDRFDASFVHKVFHLFLTEEQLEWRRDVLEKVAIERSLEGGKKAMEIGSKPERYLYKLLKEEFDDIIHHNLKVIPYKEIDITINYNDKLYCIEINGLHHYKSIFGEDKFKRTIQSDKAKKTIALNKGYNYIVIKLKKSLKVDQPAGQKYLQEKAQKIINLIKENQEIMIIEF